MSKKEPLKVGFMSEPFPKIEGTHFDEETFKLKCRRFPVEVTVSRCRLQLGENSFDGVVSSRVSISENLPLNGFASHCHIDEAETMKEAVELYAEKRGKGIGMTYNNWPSFRGHLYDKNPGQE